MNMDHWAKLPLKVASDKTLKASAKLVYALLVYHCNGKASCFPGMRTLMKECGIAKRTVEAAIIDLEQKGYITVERIKEKGNNPRNKYILSKESVPQNRTLSCKQAPKASPKVGQGVLKSRTQASPKVGHKETDQRKRPAPSHNKDVMAGEIKRPLIGPPLTETEKMLYLTPRIIE